MAAHTHEQHASLRCRCVPRFSGSNRPTLTLRRGFRQTHSRQSLPLSTQLYAALIQRSYAKAFFRVNTMSAQAGRSKCKPVDLLQCNREFNAVNFLNYGRLLSIDNIQVDFLGFRLPQATGASPSPRARAYKKGPSGEGPFRYRCEAWLYAIALVRLSLTLSRKPVVESHF